MGHPICDIARSMLDQADDALNERSDTNICIEPYTSNRRDLRDEAWDTLTLAQNVVSGPGSDQTDRLCSEAVDIAQKVLGEAEQFRGCAERVTYESIDNYCSNYLESACEDCEGLKEARREAREAEGERDSAESDWQDKYDNLEREKDALDERVEDLEGELAISIEQMNQERINRARRRQVSLTRLVHRR